MDQDIATLFKTEYNKIVAVLCKSFGFSNIQMAEDIVSNAFMKATETWGMKGTPVNPRAWLYLVSKNMAKDTLKRQQLFNQKISPEIKYLSNKFDEISIDFSDESIKDSQLKMIFAICNPVIAPNAQIGLALRILCGFGIKEIATAFLTNTETINKRLYRAKEKLKVNEIELVFPSNKTIVSRINEVLTTLYLLFNEGYYANHKDIVIQHDLCFEAIRLTYILVQNEFTSNSKVKAVLSLMCFHASRFNARTDDSGEFILYDDQDKTLWHADLIQQGNYFLGLAMQDSIATKYHIEAYIAYYHAQKEPSDQKWNSVLQLYNRLLQLEYTPIAALNRTFAFSKVHGNEKAILEAEKINLGNNHFYHLLLANLYEEIDDEKVIKHLNLAFELANTTRDRNFIQKKINQLL